MTTEKKEEEIAETINQETSSGFHLIEVHMASVASTATIMLLLFCWCVCMTCITARCKPWVWRMWRKATRGRKKRNMRAAMRATFMNENPNFTLRPMARQPTGRYPEWTSPSQSCSICKEEISKRASVHQTANFDYDLGKLSI